MMERSLRTGNLFDKYKHSLMDATDTSGIRFVRDSNYRQFVKDTDNLALVYYFSGPPSLDFTVRYYRKYELLGSRTPFDKNLIDQELFMVESADTIPDSLNTQFGTIFHRRGLMVDDSSTAYKLRVQYFLLNDKGYAAPYLESQGPIPETEVDNYPRLKTILSAYTDFHEDCALLIPQSDGHVEMIGMFLSQIRHADLKWSTDLI